ncbi:MAG: hypothetical protein GF416_08620 [Candidatus Altiarchaeales archaeon]|nr:hypothetical protein [Candidatus Altiarchaeales archaeon]MBD3417179.1 hypothetical protein [Candidatus Altiarchaeales archaeon]
MILYRFSRTALDQLGALLGMLFLVALFGVAAAYFVTDGFNTYIEMARGVFEEFKPHLLVGGVAVLLVGLVKE